MAAMFSPVSPAAFQPIWSASRQLREGQKTPARSSAARKRGANLPMAYVDPGRAELRSVLARTQAVMHRTKSGQNYEKAVDVVNAEYWTPPKTTPGAWFPNVDQVFEVRKGSVDAIKVNHLCDMLEKMPFLFKALDRIKISWLRNSYPLPLRIVRALDRDDFDLISSNLPVPIGDVNRYPGAMWSMSADTCCPRGGGTGRKSQPRQSGRRDTSSRQSRPLDRAALVSDPAAVPKSVVPHRRDWNRLLHRYMDDCAAAVLRPGGQRQPAPNRLSVIGSERRRSLTRSQQRPSEPLLLLETEPAAAPAASDSGCRPVRPVSRLMEPLHPPWQLVEEAEEGARRVSNLGTVSADDAKLVMKRCRQLKSTALGLMDQQYKAKIHKLEDNRSQRYRRKVSYLAPPYRTAEADMPAVRRRVQRRSQLEDVSRRSAAWHGRLLRHCASLRAADLPRCQQLLDRLQPFSRRDGSQTVRGSEKLCLLLMSVPVYDALQPGLQLAILFVHVHVLGGNENVFRRWLEVRALADATRGSPLIGLIRGEAETAVGNDNLSSSDDDSL